MIGSPAELLPPYRASGILLLNASSIQMITYGGDGDKKYELFHGVTLCSIMANTALPQADSRYVALSGGIVTWTTTRPLIRVALHRSE